MQLTPLYSFTTKGTIEKLGPVPDGERLKIEFRGATSDGSVISGKLHGTDWILVGPLGRGQLESVQEILTPDGQRFVVQLRGSWNPDNGGGTHLKAAGVIRSSSPHFMHLDGHVVIAEGRLHGDDMAVSVFHF